ncbi:hypothetical protein F5Y03DRAFT_105613 [Xylaria venustula]|nr:hypothetical protein F5Y03DRAFT_105613 [Xylaria venustula]
MDDPWGWDVDRVVQELCTSNRSWHQSSTPLKLPPVDMLGDALRQHEVDGEVLLTYDQTELCAELGIKILKHKSTFKNAIENIRLRSNQYRVYRKRQALALEDAADFKDQSQPPDEIQDKGASKERTGAPCFSEPALLPNGSDSMLPDKHMNKKRRITPSLVTAEIDPNRNRSIVTEADAVFSTSEILTEPTDTESTHDLYDTLATGAYLGSKSVTRFDIVIFEDRVPSEPLEEDKQLNIISSSQLIPGRMVQTHRLMKRWLLRKTAPRRTRFTKSDIVRGSNNPDHDEVLPVYGESDDDMEYDSDTWREIEAEQNEKNSQPSEPKGLTAEETNLAMDRGLQEMAFEWERSKLPKYANKANRIWNEAKRSGLKDAIDRARRELHELESRIAKMKKAFQDNDYRNVTELEKSLITFEPSIFSREHHVWLIGVLTSPSEPPKPTRPREPREGLPKPRPILADDEEALTSDSEDDLKNFIVDDDGPLANTDEERTEHDENDSIVPEAIQTPSQTKSTGLSKMNLYTPSKTTEPIFIDLTTPPKHKSHIIRYKDGKLSSAAAGHKEVTASSPLIMEVSDLETPEQKVAKALATLDQVYIDAIFSIARSYQPEDIWLDLILPALDRAWPKAPYNTHIKKDSITAYTLLRFFGTYRDGTSHRRYKDPDDKEKERLRGLYELFPQEWIAFIGFLKRLSDRFEWNQIDMPKRKPDTPSNSRSDEGGEKEPDPDSLSNDTDVSTDPVDEREKSLETGEKKKKRKRKKKRKEVARNREAAMARVENQTFMAEQEARRKHFRARLETEGSTALGSQHGKIIVNESKRDEHGFIYINDEIACRIMAHQITGVRFMWDQLVVAKERQGCLLAHTMGLGKTMQVITLLVTIAQASASDDPTVSCQIPEQLRESKTLVLCPPTLVNNWYDEFLSWIPEHHGLGKIFKVDALMSVDERTEDIRAWSVQGGVMIIGYNLFKKFVMKDENSRPILLEQPNIVIADEAHMMKNPKAETHIAAAKFRTLSRVALTGSPLANNVEEYYSMINWVAPNYLGDIREFRAHYAIPINNGLQADSTGNDRRRALRMLRVLKTDVSPKMNRQTIAVLKHGIPEKKEFVISVALSTMQRQAYEMYIQFHSNGYSDSNKVPIFAIHDLSLICASPSIFLQKLENPKSDLVDKNETVTLPQQLISEELALLRNATRAAKDEFELCWKVPLVFEILRQSKKAGDYVLLFSHSTVALNFLEGQLRMKKLSFVRLDGTTKMPERQGIVRRFNRGNIDIFLISTKAGALGLNITGANRVIIFDAQFNPQNEQQAVGRAYRIGQQKPVFVYRLVCGGTFEQKILNQAIWKMQLASRVVDKKSFVNKAPRLAKVWDMPTEPAQDELDSVLGKDIVLDALLKNEEYKNGIRAVQMMDIFEEEAVEDAELSAEDIHLANGMIQANEARRMGLPIPAHLSAALSAMGEMIPSDGYGYDIAPSGPLSLVGPLNGNLSGLRPHVQFPGNNQTSLPPRSATGTTLRSVISAPQRSPDFPLPSREHPSHDSRPPSSLPPMQLQGAEVHYRTSAQQTNVTPGVFDMGWNSLAAIETDLSRAFSIGAGFPDEATRSQVSAHVSSAIWDNIQRITPEQQRAMKLAIMGAASAQRFVEAICMGLISPQDLSQLAPESIDQQVKSWKEETEAAWETKKRAWSSRRLSRDRDPEHLQTALNRLSFTSNQRENSQQVDHTKSYRLDDREALQAVFERRRLKTQRKDDQETVRAVMERREAKGLPSQSSDAGKEPRLPDWARNVVRQAQIPVPSSSISPSTPSSPKFSQRPQPRTPFQ